MRIWICNHCHAEIPQEEKPTECPLCRHARGFDEGERPEPSDEDKKYTKVYEGVIEELEKREEGCEPQDMHFCCED